jgi:hypothetical protein
MFQLTEFYPLLWAVDGVLAAFALIILDIYYTEIKDFFAKRRMKLRDKLHFAMGQSPRRVMA